MAPGQALPAPPPVVPLPPVQHPAAQAPPAHSASAPATLRSQQPPPVFSPPPPAQPVAPLSMPVTRTQEVGEEVEEVEQTITPCHISVPRVLSTGPSEPRRSRRTTYIPGYYQQLAYEGEDAEHLDYVFSATFSDIIAAAISDLNDDPRSIREAQSQPDWPQWSKAMDHEIVTLERANTWCTVS